MNKRLHAIIPFLLVLGALPGCSNPYKDSYMSKLDRWPAGQVSRLLPPTGDVKIVTSTSMRDDAVRMMEEGWLLLGRSQFREAQVDPQGAAVVAKEIGASVILVSKEHAATVTGTMAVTEWIPPRTVKEKEQIVITSGPEAGQVIEREVTLEHQGEYRTSYVPTNTEYYDHAATYWGKLKPSIFGVIVSALADSERVALQTNRGVIVRAVIRNTPAFNADILRGDVITSFGGEPVRDPDQFFETVIARAGREVTVEVLRGGERKTYTMTLNPE